MLLKSLQLLGHDICSLSSHTLNSMIIAWRSSSKQFGRPCVGPEKGSNERGWRPLTILHMISCQGHCPQSLSATLGRVAAADSERRFTHQNKAIHTLLTLNSASPAIPKLGGVGAALSLGRIQMSSCNQHAINCYTPGHQGPMHCWCEGSSGHLRAEVGLGCSKLGNPSLRERSLKGQPLGCKCGQPILVQMLIIVASIY